MFAPFVFNNFTGTYALLLKRNYDTVAWVYDQLAALVFGDTLLQAQRYLLSAIPPAAHLLIVGGGAGRVLEEIAKLYPSGLHIDYVDASAKMIALARKRDVGQNKVRFFHANMQGAAIPEMYDLVLTPFFFDNFTDDMAETIFLSIHDRLRPGGTWLYCDFRETNVLWQKTLLKVMYLFFSVCCGVAAKHLPDDAAIFSKHGYKASSIQGYMNGFVTSVIYEQTIQAI